MIFHLNESVSFLYLIWLNMLIIHDVTLTFFIMSELHNFTSWINSVVCLWILYVMSWSNPVICYIHIIIVFFMYNCVPWMSLLVYVFVMHNFVRMTFNIIFGSGHEHLCKNDYPDYYRFLSCTFMYDWLSRLLWVFVMHIFVRMTIHILLGFCHSRICKNYYPF